ncbi:DUF456 domain-containing protein [Bacteroidales bacterium OttesenSCG-928-A17]|nr:DUF456 domain-containing protein [Bacteroidales bacterium OttesenSCG-928-A17]
MDIVLLILGILCIITGIIGCIIPALPGPPLSYIGLLLLEWSKFADYPTRLLVILLFVVILITIIDNIVPIYMTKKFGGTKWGVWGATIGLFLGFFGGIVGTIIGPFIGAFAFELIAGTQTNHAFKAAGGSFIGFFFGIGGKLVVSGVVTYYFCSALF